MSRARPEARKPAKPGPGSPSRAGPDSGLERAWGLGFKSLRPEPGPEARACAAKNPPASLGPGPSLGLASPVWGFRLGLAILKPKPPQAEPKPGLPGRAGPWTSLHPLEAVFLFPACL
ncbi:hypothetical protein C8R43DRAFT_943016 [Mycena crocata]|nr:hypothetical protein C8R43DRAFT_943016 [Mycena crocata]